MARIASTLVIMLMCGCSLSSMYIAADRATFDAIAPEYSEYVETDKGLSDEQKDRRQDTIDSWEARILEAQGADGDAAD